MGHADFRRGASTNLVGLSGLCLEGLVSWAGNISRKAREGNSVPSAPGHPGARLEGDEGDSDPCNMELMGRHPFVFTLDTCARTIGWPRLVRRITSQPCPHNLGCFVLCSDLELRFLLFHQRSVLTRNDRVRIVCKQRCQDFGTKLLMCYACSSERFVMYTEQSLDDMD